MGKADELLKAAAGAITESASHRGAPAAMPTAPAGPKSPDRLAGVARSKAALEIPLAKIARDPDQPREEFDEDALGRLADSIKGRGLLQAISVRWDEGRGLYVIIAGERRWRAATMAGLSTVSCTVIDRPMGPGELLALQCVENLLREDLRPVEEARAFRTLMELNGWSGNQLAKELGVSQPSVVAALKLLALPSPVQEMVEAGELPASSASAIASLDDPDDQAEVAARVVSEKLSRAETVEAVRKAAGRAKATASKGRAAKSRKVTERVIRTEGGPKVTVEFKRGLDGRSVATALREALGKVEAELESDQAAA